MGLVRKGEFGEVGGGLKWIAQSAEGVTMPTF